MKISKRNRFLAVVATVFLLTGCAATTDTNVARDPTRLRNEEQLCELVAAGYQPDGDRIHYPSDLQSAQARVNAGSVPASTCLKEH